MAWKTQNSTGVDCTGSSGDANRVLTLDNTSLTVSSGLLVYASGLALAVTSEYTITHNDTDSTITFVNPLWDDMAIIVKYYQKMSVGGFPLDARFIQKNIETFGNTCTIIVVSRSTGTGEYRIVTETDTEYPNISCYVQILNEGDDSVKEGKARAGDLIFWFDSDQEDYCVNGNKITYDSKTLQIQEVKKYDALGGTNYLIECRTEQV